jgi:hypothetical protein
MPVIMSTGFSSVSLREFEEKLIKTMLSSRPEYGIPGQTDFSRSFANKRAGNKRHSKPGKYGVVVDQADG